MKKFFTAIILAILIGIGLNAQKIAFPGAEGYGKYTVGGRGGVVYEVTNLNDAGPGSLRAAVEASGPRTVVFRVSGTIVLNSNLTIRNPYITIAGQTAPGDGICLSKYQILIDADQVIIRYIRVRLGDQSGVDDDAIGGRFHKNIVLDHLSASWSVDETMSVYHCDSVTIQWCLISESMYNSNHIKGHHGFGGIWGSNYSSYHHNLLADHSSRNPRMASGTGYFDYRNNVIYNWGYNSCYGGENVQTGDPDHVFTEINMVANYYKPGPATQPGSCTYRIANPGYNTDKTDYGKWYIADNYMVGNSTVTADNWNGGVQPSGTLADTTYFKLNSPWPAMSINQQTAQDAYDSVVVHAGCTFPKRDKVDARIIHDVINGDATYEGLTYEQDQTVPDKSKICGIIDSQTDVGGWPVLKSTPAPTDTDHDGMPDDWETANSLNPNDASDRNAYTLDASYTNLEVYINSIIKTLPNIPVTGVFVYPETADVSLNNTYSLSDTVAPADASNENVLWKSDNPAVATVSILGVVTGVSLGTANIIATTQDGGFKDTCVVTVINIPVTGIKITVNDSVRIGDDIQLSDTIFPSDASNKNVNWSSGNTAIATVSPSGVVTGVSAGTTNIIATTEDGSFADTCVVKVYYSALPTPLIQLNFDDNKDSVVTNTGSLSANFYKSDPPSWSTNVPVPGGTSSVDFGTTTGNYYVESDTIISQLAGIESFTVTGWVNNRSSAMGSGGNRIVSWINSGGDGVDIVYINDGSLKVGINQWPDKTIAISSAGKIPTDDAAPASNWRFFAVTYDATSTYLKIYFGDNTNPAMLDKTFAYKQGAVGTGIGHLCIGQFNTESIHYGYDRMFRGLIDQVKIYGSVLSPLEIQVDQNIGKTSVFVTGVDVTPATASIFVGDSTQLTATISPAGADNTSVSWGSSNTSVATVSSTGLVTGVAQGTATITVTSEDGGFTASCNVTVNPVISSISGIQDDGPKVNCFPNPFSDELTFNVSVDEPQRVSVELFDVSGRKIATIADHNFQAGNNSFVWNSNNSVCNLKPGFYIVSVTAYNSNIKKQIKLLKK